MLELLRKRREGDDTGFTLIELMVVVLIIAILIAIAIPTFLGARERAQDRAAQSDLRNGLTAAKTYYTDAQKYDASAGALEAIEPSLDFEAASGTPTHGVVSIDGNGTDTICLYTASASGKVFGIKDVTGATGTGTTYATTAAACDQATGWGPKW